jgi:intracellular sulfur oxidation DsrE/DsrF family protein
MQKARLVLLSALALALPGTLRAQQRVFPVIKGYGGARLLPDAAMQPRKDLEYKVVFNITQAGGKPDSVSAGLERLAGFINLYAGAGVPLRNTKLVAVLSGPATAAVLDDEHYRARFGVANPNLGLINQLTKAGVKLYVCGQALAGMHLDPSWVNPEITRALTAGVVVLTYEMQGYANVKY